MKKFKYFNAATAQDAVSVLNQYKGVSKIIAGGTDVLGQIKDEILPDYPQALVNLKTIPDLDYIKEEGKTLKIGPLTRLADIAENKTLKEKYTALAEAAHRTASPSIREMGTIAGNICQSTRCWYYWNPDNRFDCMRKGGSVCYAMLGEGRYHSIFGGMSVTTPPCASKCPAGTDIPSYLAKIREGEFDEAAEILLDYNPLPSITGRVCPHFCEGSCNRNDFDEAVSVNAVERFMGDYILDHADQFYKKPETEKNKKVAIVGSGPAGLSAAYFLRRLGYGVTIFEEMEKPGGMLSYGIPPYRLPKDVVQKQVEALKDTGISLKLGVAVGKDVDLAALMKDFDAVFLAGGAWKQRPSGVEGESSMLSGFDFLKSFNSGSRDVPWKKVAVIGGGNVAMDVARTLLRMGVEPVVVYRRTEAEMPAVREEIEKAKEENIQFDFLTQPVKSAKKGSGVVLTCMKMKLGEPDKSGRPRPVPVEGSEFDCEYDAVFTAIGELPDTKGLPEEFISGKGWIKTDPSDCSVAKNVFAGGDFVSGPSTVVQAIASGSKAADAINSFLGGAKPEKTPAESLPGRSFDPSCFQKSKAAKFEELSISERIKSVDVEEASGLKVDEACAEANRCMNCSCLAVNNSDIAPALIALDAKIKTTKRSIDAEDFFTAGIEKSTVLEDDELVTEIQVPAGSFKSSFLKFALRKSIDFPIVNCAVMVDQDRNARICINSVYNIPYRATDAEKIITGKEIDKKWAEAAADAAVGGNVEFPKSRYKVQIARALVKRALLACK